MHLALQRLADGQLGPEHTNLQEKAYIHTYMHTLIHTYINTYIHKYIHSYIHKYIHTYTHTYVHVCMYAYIHIHTYLDIYKYRLKQTTKYIYIYVHGIPIQHDAAIGPGALTQRQLLPSHDSDSKRRGATRALGHRRAKGLDSRGMVLWALALTRQVHHSTRSHSIGHESWMARP